MYQEYIFTGKGMPMNEGSGAHGAPISGARHVPEDPSDRVACVSVAALQTAAVPSRALRRPLHPSITEDIIERMARHFYGRVRRDPDLGPIFDRAITDWEPHLRTMMAFWSSVMLMSGRFHGQPVQKHRALTAVRPEHFIRWLALFRHSAREVCPEPVAELFIDRAERIAESLQGAMFDARSPAQVEERP